MVAIVTALAHWPVLRAQGQSLDDDSFLTINPLVTQPGWPSTWRFFSEVLHPSSVGGYYLPVTMTSLMLDCAMGGSTRDLHAFHRTNLFLHVIATTLVVLLLHQLFGVAIPAGITGLLFGVHPLTVESVAWLSQRKTLLAATFAFACLLAYARRHRGGGRSWWNASIALYALALLSKPAVVTLPFLLLLLDWWPLRRLDRRAVAEKWPFFLLSVTSSAIAVLSQVGTMGTTALPQAGAWRFLLQSCYLQVFHIGQMIWPLNLSSVHPPPQPVALSNPLILFSVIAVCLLALALVWSLRRSRGPLAGWLFYLTALAPTFGVLVWSVIIVYDNYVYFPALGILLLIGSGLAGVWTSAAFRGHGAKAALLAVAILAGAAEFRATRATLRYWQNNDTLWEHFLEVLPDSPALREKYGVLLANEGRFGDAIPHFRRAVALAPANAGMHHNLGRALLGAGRPDAAVPALETAASLIPNEPEYARELAMALQRTGRIPEAAARFRDLLRLKPRDIDALVQLGTLLAIQGDTEQAVGLARAAVALAPSDARTHFVLAMILLGSGSMDGEGVEHLRQAVRHSPDWALPGTRLAWVLATSPDPALFDPGEALRLSARATELTGGQDPDVLDTRAAAQAAAGHFDQAVETARDAARLATRLHADSLIPGIHARMRMYQRGVRHTERPRHGSGSR